MICKSTCKIWLKNYKLNNKLITNIMNNSKVKSSQQSNNQDFIYNYPEHILEMLEQSENKKLEWKYQEALEIAQKILVENTECIPALEEVADNFLSLNEIQKSEKTVKYILSVFNDSYTANYIMWFIHSKKWEFAASIDYLETANKLKHNNAEILRCLWWSYFMSWDKSKWVLVLERALNLFPGDIMIMSDLIMCYLELLKLEQASNLIIKAKEIDSEDPRLLNAIKILNELSGNLNAQKI